MAEREALVKWRAKPIPTSGPPLEREDEKWLKRVRRSLTFLQTLLRVILLQRETWVNPKTDLGHRIEQEFAELPVIPWATRLSLIEQEFGTPPPTATDSSGPTAPPATFSRSALELTELRHITRRQIGSEKW